MRYPEDTPVNDVFQNYSEGNIDVSTFKLFAGKQYAGFEQKDSAEFINDLCLNSRNLRLTLCHEISTECQCLKFYSYSYSVAVEGNLFTLNLPKKNYNSSLQEILDHNINQWEIVNNVECDSEICKSVNKSKSEDFSY